MRSLCAIFALLRERDEHSNLMGAEEGGGWSGHVWIHPAAANASAGGIQAQRRPPWLLSRPTNCRGCCAASACMLPAAGTNQSQWTSKLQVSRSSLAHTGEPRARASVAPGSCWRRCYPNAPLSAWLQVRRGVRNSAPSATPCTRPSSTSTGGGGGGGSNNNNKTDWSARNRS